MDVFLHDLNQAYSTDQITTDYNSLLRYLDYAMIEQQMPMTAASMFWRDTLHDCNLDQALPLPFDRYRLSDEHRTGRGVSFSFDFGEDISHDFLSYSLSNDITVEQLALASYYIFLFKLTNGESDLCIGMNTHGRYKEELMSVIGMFVNNIPLRCQLDPHWSFHQLAEHVKEIITGSLMYSYFPLQRILTQHPNATKPAFLDTSFEFQSHTCKTGRNEVMIGNARLVAAPISLKIHAGEIMSKFDFVLTIQHDLDTDQFSCTINASLDLFDRKTANMIAQRFHSMLQQLFNVTHVQMKKPIYEFSLILPDEKVLMKSMNNTQLLFPSASCIHDEFVRQVMKQPQKIAVELDDQSLTYSELLYYVQVLSLNLLNEQCVIVGDIVCQFVERSISMVIGMMAIEMIGGVYCPLSPRDPKHRLHALLQQIQSGLVLVHYLTKNKFKDNFISLDIDSVLIDNELETDVDVNRLSSVNVTVQNVAYAIFTSGSTGTPKVARIRHRTFSECMRSSTYIGEAYSVKLVKLIRNIVTPTCRIWNLYGPAETTIGCISHIVDITSDTKSIPIGGALPNYQCLILDSWLQCVVISQEGELYVGGVGVFAGYLGRNDLTAKALIMIDSDIFYRTGDLVKMDHNGLLHYRGRKDHQIKLHGQRIELGEIEQCLLNTSVSACVVIKWDDDHLIAYVQSSDIDAEQLRKHCQTHLPPHMVPSLFIVLDKLPLNANGKIDRKQLPSPNFALLSLPSNSDPHTEPNNVLEVQIHSLWCEILQRPNISTNMSFFSIGGHSLLLMQLFHRYKMIFNLDTSNVNMAQLIQYSTISDHAQLINNSRGCIQQDEAPWLLLYSSLGNSLFLVIDGLRSVYFIL
ncbi:unnamed protein product [Rotaria sp. Silwood1]|nr:unnamed protein product [Rotaria sp. Silwood1]CAF3822888.1 unnamed protein product [Rotaria sp. Silwood1]